MALCREGVGTLLPRAVAVAVHSAMAFLTLATTSSGVSPSLTHPGKSGTTAAKPPPSACGIGEMITGYSSVAIWRPYRRNEVGQFLDIYGLARTLKRYRQDFRP